jgi:hypothetical protein
VARKKRAPIPSRTEERVLFLAEHTCCLCRARGKDVQLHHIDGNPSNNAVENLAVVCLDCHSRVSGPRGMGRSYKPGEMRRYKRSWELQVQEQRRVHRSKVPHQKELVSQIDLIICEILVLDPRSERIVTLFRLLYELYLWRGSRRLAGALLDGVGHLAIMGGLGADHVAKHIPDFLWRMCWHFVGPDRVTMSRQDVAQVRRCIDVMETLAEFNCSWGHGRATIAAITASTERLFEVSLWYSDAGIARRIISLYKKALKACGDTEGAPFGYGHARLWRSIRCLRQLLKEEKPKWRRLDHDLAALEERARDR